MRKRSHAKESDDDLEEEKEETRPSVSAAVVLPAAGATITGGRGGGGQRQQRRSSGSTSTQTQRQRRGGGGPKMSWNNLRALLLPRIFASSGSMRAPPRSSVAVLSVAAGISCCVLFMVVAVGMVIVGPLLEHLFGNSYSPRGGLVGVKVDRYLEQKFLQQLRNDRRNKYSDLLFPDVTIKATRKIRKDHHNQYLEELLHRHQLNRTNIEWKGYYSPNTMTNENHNDNYNQRHPRRTIKLWNDKSVIATSQLQPLQHDLRAEDCGASWLCQRCLNTAFAGTFNACSVLCRKCYIRILSTTPHNHKVIDFAIRAEVAEEEEDRNLVAVQRRIPRIIHQTSVAAPAPPTMLFPELARIQESWRSVSGYEYHFYDGDRRQSFVDENYPSLVAQVYDRIGSERHQSEFFKLLVLFKVGGVYADSRYYNMQAKQEGKNCLWPKSLTLVLFSLLRPPQWT